MISRPDKGLHTIPCIVLLNPKVSTYIKYSVNDLWVVITFSKAQRILESLIKGMGDNEDFAFLKASSSLCSYILVTTLKKKLPFWHIPFNTCSEIGSMPYNVRFLLHVD